MIRVYLKYFILSVCFAFALQSCSKPYLNNRKPEMVVEGWIGDGEFPIVMLTWSLPVTEDPIVMDESTLSKYVITLGAKVEISDDMGNSVVLTGMRNKRYPTGYIFTTSDLKGLRGHSYTLNVSFMDEHAVAHTTIPDGECALSNLQSVQVPDTENYYVSSDIVRSNAGMQAVCFQTPGLEESYYRLCYHGVCDADMEHSTFYRGITSSVQDYSLYFKKNEKVYLRLSTLDDNSFHYYSDMERVVMGNHNAVFPVLFNIYSNVEGALGAFCGLVNRYYELEIN